MITLRPYQEEAAQAVLSAFQNRLRRVLYQLPTGTGKTVTFVAIHNRFPGDGPTVVLAHREELLDQAARAFATADPEARIGIEQGERRADPDCEIVIGSVQTLSRGTRLASLRPKLLIVDEAHHAVAASYMNIFKRFGVLEEEGPCLVGCTATPKRLDRLNLQTVFERQVYQYSIRQAIEDGWLSDVRGYRVRSDVSLDTVNTTAGDFNQRQLADTVRDQERTRRALSHWWNVARDRPTVAFCASVEHAQEVAAEFQRGGFRAACVWGAMGSEERARVLEQFQQGELQILTNVEILTEGWDHPPLSCIMMLRPTQSWTLYTQMVGRGTRLAPGKEDLIVIDVVDNCRKHSLAAVPAILDLPPGLDLEGKKLSQAARYIDEIGERAAVLADPERLPDTFSGLQTMLQQVDLFAQVEPPMEVQQNCELAWVKLSPESYFVSCGTALDGTAQREARLEQDLMGQWVTRLFEGGQLVAGQGPEALDVEDALRQADQFVCTTWRDAFRVAGRQAGWRKDPPTERQLNLLRRLGYEERVLTMLTKGAASNLISAVLQSRK